MLVIPDHLDHLSNVAIAAILGRTPQAVFYARRRKAGLCVRCGSPAAAGSQHCSKHRRQSRRYQREKQREIKGHKPWKPGSRGRPPVSSRKDGQQ